MKKTTMRLLTAAAYFILVFTDSSSAIDCYECDEIPGSSKKPCPGVNLIQYGRKFDACIIYRLSSGRIVFQHGVPALPKGDICSEEPSKLRIIIQSNFRQAGTPMCCRSDGCNKDIPPDFDVSDQQQLYLEDYRNSEAAQNYRDPQSRSTAAAITATVTLLSSLGLLLLFRLK